ncbi:unnamed protein product [Alternaria burnsii]|nr:unnamed protein product [Alternaria burnsii]
MCRLPRRSRAMSAAVSSRRRTLRRKLPPREKPPNGVPPDQSSTLGTGTRRKSPGSRCRCVGLKSHYSSLTIR